MMQTNKISLKNRTAVLTSNSEIVKAALLLSAIFVFTVSVFASISDTLDKVDPNFNVRVQTSSYGVKSVTALYVLPDNKILAGGSFNNYNGQPVGGLIRLNADGSLDTSFNNNLLTPFLSVVRQIVVQNDGKIVINVYNQSQNGQNTSAVSIMRLNIDGTIDTGFNFPFAGNQNQIALDAEGRILVLGGFLITENGAQVHKGLIRLNSDGSYDTTFNFQANLSINYLVTQNNKVLLGTQGNGFSVRRVNEDGSLDNSFTSVQFENYGISGIVTQPDNKILVLNERNLYRLNENGTSDNGFQTAVFPFPNSAVKIHLSGDGKITIGYRDSVGGFKVVRFLSNGATDPSYSNYTYRNYSFSASAMQSDGSVLLGDEVIGGISFNGNGFVRVLPSGLADSNFNPGGSGFLTITPGRISAIKVQTDDKILIAGNFDLVSGIQRSSIARLNSDATVDNSFSIRTTPTGNYFSVIRDIFTVVVQPDGKIVVTGGFEYFINGSRKIDMVRLNADGSIDPSFNLGQNLVYDLHTIVNAGKNRFAFQNDGKIFVGMQRNCCPGTTPAIRLNANGTADNSFAPTTFNSKQVVYIMDVAIQQDGKLLIGGRYKNDQTGSDSGIEKSFLVRLNSNGSRDETFQTVDEADREISAFKLLADGKILAAKLIGVYSPMKQTVILRFNSDGSPDNSFNAGSGANGKINGLEVLPDGNIMLAGKFSSFDNESRVNLAKLNADGSLNPALYIVNQEIFSLTLDNQNRVLIGGDFTSIAAGNEQSVSRSYAARLIVSAETGPRTRFDFDGNGRSDFAVFNLETGFWSIYGGSGHPAIGKFGAGGDKPAAADFDGDGKTDLAVFRPSEGNWYIQQSAAGFKAIKWGANGDKPVAGDFDGDGKADVAVWRPSNGVWYILQSASNQLSAAQFGQNGDIPLSDVDFDGDKRDDIVVFRPSNGVFYWLASGSGNQFHAVQFGSNGDIPAVADYNGDGKADLAVFRPSTGIWYQYLTTASGAYNFAAAGFGQNGDVPVPADYNGDGKADIAVRRGAVWHLSLSGQSYSAVSFGDADAQALASTPVQ